MSTIVRVKPSGKLAKPTPAPIALHGLDVLLPHLFIRLHFFFAHSEAVSDPVEHLKASLADALDFYPPVAGSLRPGTDGKLTVLSDGRGVDFTQQDVPYPYSDVPEGDSESLGPQVELTLDAPVFAVKVTKFSCGTVALCVAMDHWLTDLQGCVDFIATWAKVARGEVVAPSSVPHDWAHAPLRYFTEVDAAPLVAPPSDASSHFPPAPPPGPPAPATQLRYFISDSSLQTLKEDCTPRTNGTGAETNGVSWISSGDALTALLWRASVRCRRGADAGKEKMDMFALSMDGRDRSPGKAMANGQYLGNFIVPATMGLPVDTLLQKSPEALSYIAGTIRKELQQQTKPEVIKARVEFVESKPNLNAGEIVNQFDTMLTNWARFALAGPANDFGWGAPLGFAIGCIKLPTRGIVVMRANGGVLNVLALEEGAAELMKGDEELLKYGKFVSRWVL
ncbi:transferase-domain-containing protein [Dentipellis sp. KUC8613]|nr:transferase-domain-containing protein [Dentipellis sp. KUC8613]